MGSIIHMYRQRRRKARFYAKARRALDLLRAQSSTLQRIADKRFDPVIEFETEHLCRWVASIKDDK